MRQINLKNPILAFIIFVLIDILTVIMKLLIFIPAIIYLSVIKALIASYVSSIKKMIRMHNYIYDKVLLVYGDIPAIRDLIKNHLKDIEV